MRAELGSQVWYYKQNGETFGPVSREQLRALVTTGQLRPRQVVWRVGDQSLLFLHASTVVSGSGDDVLYWRCVEFVSGI
jgi:hypothetical protein